MNMLTQIRYLLSPEEKGNHNVMHKWMFIDCENKYLLIINNTAFHFFWTWDVATIVFHHCLRATRLFYIFLLIPGGPSRRVLCPSTQLLPPASSRGQQLPHLLTTCSPPAQDLCHSTLTHFSGPRGCVLAPEFWWGKEGKMVIYHCYIPQAPSSAGIQR